MHVTSLSSYPASYLECFDHTDTSKMFPLVRNNEKSGRFFARILSLFQASVLGIEVPSTVYLYIVNGYGQG
jgi:hypothetical protein